LNEPNFLTFKIPPLLPSCKSLNPGNPDSDKIKNLCHTESRYQNQLFVEKYFPPNGGGLRREKKKREEGKRARV
jgi:hypothetical protein